MFDQKDRHPGIADLADRCDDFHDLARDKSCHHLVEKQEFGFCGKRPCKLEPFSSGDREGFRRLVQHAAHADLLGDESRALKRLFPASVTKMRADCDILQNGQAREGLDDLERPGQAEPADGMGRATGDVLGLKTDPPAIGLHESADHREQGGLARTVRSDQGDDPALFHGERGIVHRNEAAVAFGDVLDAQHHLASFTDTTARCFTRPNRRARPTIPSGR